jgi:hypothetical protein
VPSVTRTTADHKQVKGSASENLKVNEDRDTSDESDAEDDGVLGRIQPEPAEGCKLVCASLRNAHLCYSSRSRKLSLVIRGHLGPRGTKRSQHDDRKNRSTVSVLLFLTHRTVGFTTKDARGSHCSMYYFP